MGRTMPLDCPGCGKVLDWGDFGPSGNDPDQAQLDKPQCTCHGWEWNGEWWEAASTTDPAAETLPNAQEPNPYRVTVVVEQDSDLMWCVYIDHILRHGAKDYVYVAEFPTKEEADTHAALILAALHKAVME